MKSLRLASSPFVHAPGLVDMLRNEVQFKKRWAYKVLRDGYGLTSAQCKRVLLGPPPTVEGDVVVFS